jgi:hypothetical protein
MHPAAARLVRLLARKYVRDELARRQQQQLEQKKRA